MCVEQETDMGLSARSFSGGNATQSSDVPVPEEPEVPSADNSDFFVSSDDGFYVYEFKF